MNAGFREVGKRFQVRFVDNGDWDIELSADLVHLSEQGNRQFATKMAECLQLLLKEMQVSMKPFLSM